MSNYIYFIQAGGESGPIKIGYSGDVEKRLPSLQTGNHEPLEMLAKFEHRNAQATEAELHDMFADLRMEGEWFRFDQRIASLISAWKLIQRGPLDIEVDSNEARVPWRLLGKIRETRVRDELNHFGWWVVEWSESQKITHVQPLISSLSQSHQALLFGCEWPSDYQIVAIVETDDQALKLAEELEPWLRSLADVRALMSGPKRI